MAKLDPALWRDMMTHLRRRHDSICRQWFEQLQPREVEAGLLRIQAASRVQQNYLEHHCREPFTEAAQAATGALVSVRFVPPEAAGASVAGPAGLAPPPASTNGSRPALTPAPQADPSRLSPPVPSSAPPGLAPNGEEPGDDQIVLSPDYSFEQFITGPNNQLACAASVAVANQPGTAYNPLFIHGGVGLGKTHLLQAVCQRILHAAPATQILYVSCDAFMNQFIECVQAGRMNQFRHRYRHVDVLVIDDIHCLGNRERSQEEFFHTFNELYQSRRQIVLSSDAPPAEIPHLEERLVSRFQWGLVAHVSKPQYETRVAILRAKSRLRGVGMPDEVIFHLAGRIDSNARELEGALTTIQAHANLQQRPIDLDLARQALGEPIEQTRTSQVTLQHIIDAVTHHYQIRLADLQSRRRHKSVTEPRQVCMYLARQRTRFSLEEIGGHFGGRDHTTVMHSVKIVQNRLATETPFAHRLERMDQAIHDALG